MNKPVIYLIGALRNRKIIEIAESLRGLGFEVFEDWIAPGEDADTKWKEYEQARGHSYLDALKGYACQHILEFDKSHLDRADIGVLIMPAGRSGHVELGYMIGKGKRAYVLLEDDNPERWDIMLGLANGVFTSLELLIEELNLYKYRPEMMINSSSWPFKFNPERMP